MDTKLLIFRLTAKFLIKKVIADNLGACYSLPFLENCKERRALNAETAYFRGFSRESDAVR